MQIFQATLLFRMEIIFPVSSLLLQDYGSGNINVPVVTKSLD